MIDNTELKYTLIFIWLISLTIALISFCNFETQKQNDVTAWTCNEWQISEYGPSVTKAELQNQINRFNRNDSHDGWLYAEVDFNSENVTIEVNNLSKTKIDHLNCDSSGVYNQSCELGNHSSFSYTLDQCTEYIKTKSPQNLSITGDFE